MKLEKPALQRSLLAALSVAILIPLAGHAEQSQQTDEAQEPHKYGAELIYRHIYEKRMKRKDLRQWVEVNQKKVRDGEISYDAFNLSPDEPDGPLPVPCGVNAIGIGLVLSAPPEDHVHKVPIALIWTRDTPGARDKRNALEQKIKFEPGEDRVYLQPLLTEDYWFKRNGTIKARVLVLPRRKAFEVKFKVSDCKK